MATVDARYASLVVKCVAAEALAEKKLDEAREHESTVKQAASTGAVMVNAVKNTETMVDDTGYDDSRKMLNTLPAKPACGFTNGKPDQADEAKTDVVDPVRIKFKVRVSSGVGVCLGVRGSFM